MASKDLWDYLQHAAYVDVQDLMWFVLCTVLVCLLLNLSGDKGIAFTGKKCISS